MAYDIRTCGTWLAAYRDNEKVTAVDMQPMPAHRIGSLLVSLDLADSTKEVPDTHLGSFPDHIDG